MNPAIEKALRERDPSPIQALVKECEKAGAGAIDINSGGSLTIWDTYQATFLWEIAVQDWITGGQITGGGVTPTYTVAADGHSLTIVPEPATMLLFGLGGLLLRRRKA